MKVPKKLLSIAASAALLLGGTAAVAAPAQAAFPINPKYLTNYQYQHNCFTKNVSCYWQANKWSWGTVYYKCKTVTCSEYTGATRTKWPLPELHYKYPVTRYRL